MGLPMAGKEVLVERSHVSSKDHPTDLARLLKKSWGRLSSLPSQHSDAAAKQKKAEVADRNVCPTCSMPVFQQPPRVSGIGFDNYERPRNVSTIEPTMSKQNGGAPRPNQPAARFGLDDVRYDTSQTPRPRFA